nr:short chain dehydrogenase [Klebsiella pneumoniae]
METTLGAIDVWINNAMTTVLAPFRQMSEEEFRRVTEVTYLGYVNGTRAALEVMIPGIGVIIQAGSALAWRSIHCSRLTAERKRRSAALPMPCEPN